jgi:hypothetical protein
VKGANRLSALTSASIPGGSSSSTSGGSSQPPVTTAAATRAAQAWQLQTRCAAGQQVVLDLK